MIEIRKGKLTDTESIVELQLRMAHETEGLQLDRKVVTKGVQGIFSQPERGTYWVAQEKGKLLAVFLSVPEWSDWRNATVLWIHSLYVIPEARKKGVFSRMFRNLKTRVEQSSELAGLRLYVDKQNKPAQKVYEKLGMNKHHYELYEWLK
jgi:GNAT superfamily N-acetyltransferase